MSHVDRLRAIKNILIEAANAAAAGDESLIVALLSEVDDAVTSRLAELEEPVIT